MSQGVVLDGLDVQGTEGSGVIHGAGHVDRVVESGVGVAPEALQWLVQTQRVPAGPGEDLVHGHHRAPRRPHLGAPDRRALGKRDLPAGFDDVPDVVDVREECTYEFGIANWTSKEGIILAKPYTRPTLFYVLFKALDYIPWLVL